LTGTTTADAPEIILQSRGWRVFGFALSIAVLTLGEAFRVGRITHEPSRHWPWSGESLGYFMVACGLVFAVAALSQLLQSARLILTREELIYERPWKRQRWKWRDVSAFEIGEDEHRNKLIRFGRPSTTRPGELYSLTPWVSEIPQGWAIGLDEVCARLNAARDRWG
jgi:hypothetical protein